MSIENRSYKTVLHQHFHFKNFMDNTYVHSSLSNNTELNYIFKNVSTRGRERVIKEGGEEGKNFLHLCSALDKGFYYSYKNMGICDSSMMKYRLTLK